jgi:hypothetical protein
MIYFDLSRVRLHEAAKMSISVGPQVMLLLVRAKQDNDREPSVSLGSTGFLPGSTCTKRKRRKVSTKVLEIKAEVIKSQKPSREICLVRFGTPKIDSRLGGRNPVQRFAWWD